MIWKAISSSRINRESVVVKDILMQYLPYKVQIRHFKDMSLPIPRDTEQYVLRPIKKWMMEKFLQPAFYYDPDQYMRLVGPISDRRIAAVTETVKHQLEENLDKKWAYYHYTLFLVNKYDALLVKLQWG